MTTIEGALTRAGFWRRFGALVIDTIVAVLLLVPAQVLVAVLFLQTNGAVQGNLGLASLNCVPVTELPQALEPPPPSFTSTMECTASIFGFRTSRNLLIVKVDESGQTPAFAFLSYSLGPDGQAVDAFDVSWLGSLVFLAYLVLMETWRGATFGKLALHIRTFDIRTPATAGLPVMKAIARYLTMMIGLVPPLLVAYWWQSRLAPQGTSISTDVSTLMMSPRYVASTAGAGLIQIAWLLWIIVSVSKKRDPIYDRIAGTSVLRTG